VTDTHRYHKFDPANAARLLLDERAEFHPPKEVLALLDLHPGQIVADVGCGPGFYTLPIARAVAPGGEVFALDIRPEMLALLRERLSAERIDHVRPMLSQESVLPLEDGGCGRLVATFLLHELVDPSALLAEVRRVLRPNGRGLAVDWEPRESPVGPPLEARVPAERASEWLRTAGLLPEPAVPFGPYSYAIVFRRP
jgi:ubiquinone/menaquinone biosynthesis C-methylase UbiE